MNALILLIAKKATIDLNCEPFLADYGLPFWEALVKDRWIRYGLFCSILVFASLAAATAQTSSDQTLVTKFELKKSGLELQRRTQVGSFFDVVGHKSAALGYENRALEAWVYPLKILDDFELSFRIEGYPLEFRGPDIAVLINARPEATIFTYSHAAFTVRQIIYAAADVLKSHFIPIVITGSVEGRNKAKETYNRLLSSAQALYDKNVSYYERLQNETTNITTPDERLNKAFEWAKVGIDKGIATNPLLGTGLVAGFRTSGDSERPGFAWFFGRDSLWTSLAINSYGDFGATKTALQFLNKFQRADGRIPHEISQSASLIPWFTDYEFPWNSADGSPLYVIAHGDRWRATGDKDFLKANWDSIVKAYRFSAASDTDGNHLIENSTKTKFGHGWVEGGGLYPPHEEIYMQGLWIEASRSLAEMADAVGDSELAETARANAERTRRAMEQTYWLSDRSYYAFATKRPPAEPPKADPGPNRARRQARMEELSKATIIDEDTVLPAVPLWWRTASDDRAQLEIDHLGSGRMATDWGSRIISDDSKLYDPLSYHYGSVWPLFTGLASTV